MSATTEPSAKLLGEVALIACGRRKGKIRSCPSCESKAPTLLNIARTGAIDALAAAICGGTKAACRDCHDKAQIILDETAERCAACGEAGP
ncbi:hypothetical protein ACQEVS_10080 [Streptomyces sp. CA-181903]|uniref:hypothetical protein n=1 Tax=Streptomyces sp. CA-181903 TaxID=3240055 RepID=UPI003D8B9782